MKLNELKREAAVPVRVILVPPSTFADTWGGKPSDNVAFGIRTLSEGDKRRIRQRSFQAAKEAASGDTVDGANPEDVYHEHMMRLAVASAICDPNDITRMPEMIRFDDQLFTCLTEGGARFLFDEMLKLEVETSPTHPEATADDIVELIEFVAEEDCLAVMNSEQRASFLRHLRFAADIKREATLEEHLEEL